MALLLHASDDGCSEVTFLVSTLGLVPLEQASDNATDVG
jgi:hypothetical protein